MKRSASRSESEDVKVVHSTGAPQTTVLESTGVPREVKRSPVNRRAKYSCIRDLIENCITCNKPGQNIATDEQTFSTKARCRFVQYMANKPRKFGIKFWLAADVKSKYLLKGFL